MKTLGEISKAVAWSKKQWEERIERADDRKEVKLTTCCSKAHWEETDRYFGRTNGEPEEFYIFYDSLCCEGRQFVDTYRFVKTEERR